jgi:hypothetical protein
MNKFINTKNLAMNTQIKIGAVILTVLLPIAFYYELSEVGACLIGGIAFCMVGIKQIKI